jgi:GTP pyrophosphokinase
MKRQGIELEDIHDVIGFRIIVDDVSSCYQALGVVHEHFKPVPGRIKDLIALPKPNGYQSLHTTVIGPRGKRVEIQIRTKEMDEVAESGIAAHWIYKQGGGSGGGGKNSANQFAWLRQLVDDVRRQSDPKEFVKSVKEDLFAKEVFVFSPTGDIYPLAR